jgi:hypothetical protein
MRNPLIEKCCSNRTYSGDICCETMDMMVRQSCGGRVDLVVRCSTSNVWMKRGSISTPLIGFTTNASSTDLDGRVMDLNVVC